QLGFAGVIMTDDLAMDAIAEADFEKPPEVLAVLAGKDMLITTDYKRSINALREAVEAGSISEQMLDEAVLRILIWKIDLGLIA
nr:beta-hexosaminidase [Lachnospiraceae bacterium]